MTLRAVVAFLFVASVLTPSARAQEVDYVLDPPEPRVGDVVRFTISLTRGALTGSATFAGKTVPGFQTGGLLNVYFGIDLDVKPGSHQLEYEMPARNNEVVKGSVLVLVKPREFATESLEVEEKYTALDEATQQRADREAKELEAIWSTASPQRLWAKAFVPPAAGPLGSPFGLRRMFNGEPRSPHSGLDIKAPLGAEVYAANAGKVVLVKDLFFTGNTVILDHGLGLYTVYAHLSRIDVATGDDVGRAKVVGLVGATGRVTGPHLHWAAKIVGARVDPGTLPGMTP
jgi:murein DD-endopeptidase MepM/ murein hydrolase activator NlpD